MPSMPREAGRRAVVGGDLRGVQVNVIGELAVSRDGAELVGIDIGSRKARTLLALLAVNRPRYIAVDHITAVLWETEPPRRAAANVATLVSRLRTILGPGSILGVGATGYRLGAPVQVDLHEAVRLVDEAEAALAARRPAAATAPARRALALLDVPVPTAAWLADALLGGEYMAAWAETVRGLYTQLLRRARRVVAEAALATGDVRTAARVAEAAVHGDPLDEAAHRLLMRATDQAGEPARAVVAYHRLTAALTRELGVDPAPATRDLYAEILRRNAAQGLAAAS